MDEVLTYEESDPDLIEFVCHKSSGTVHVAVHPTDRAAWWRRYRARTPINAELWPEHGDVAVMAVLVMKPQPCICGHLGVRDEDEGTDCFDDERLCRRCWRATPEARRPLLFEHDRPAVSR